MTENTPIQVSAIHEIANLISRIKKHSQQLLQATRGAVDQPTLVARAADIANDVLASEFWLMVVEAGGELSTSAPPVTVNFHMEFTRCIAAFKNRIKEKNLKIKIDADVKIHMISTHPAAPQIPYIVLDNAVKYSANGGAVEVRMLEPRMDVHVFRISSNGPFISDAELSEIQRVGGRGRAAEATGASGAGKGIQILSKIVAVSKGTLSFQTTPFNMEVGGIPQGEFVVEVSLPNLAA